jgi:TonB family protein
MSLRQVDKLVRDGHYAQALAAINRARELEPGNPYTAAYEVRVRALLEEAVKNPPPTVVTPAGKRFAPATLNLPSVEQQLNAIATPRGKVIPLPPTITAPADPQVTMLSQIADHLGHANTHLAKNNYGLALAELDKATTLNPGNGDILALGERIRAAQSEALALETIQHERLEREQIAREEREARDRQIKGWLEHAKEFIATGFLEEAGKEVELVLALEPDNTDAVVLRQEVVRLNDERRKRAELEQEELEAGRAEASVEKLLAGAQVALSQGDVSEALRCVTTAAMLDPDNPEVARCEESIRLAQEHTVRKEAAKKHTLRRPADTVRSREIADAEQEISKKKSDIDTRLNKARVLFGRGEYAHARVEIEHALLLNPLHQEARHLEQLVTASQGAAAAAASDPDRAKASMIAGYLADAKRARAQGRPEDAIGAVARILILDPQNEDALSLERRIQSEIGKKLPASSLPDESNADRTPKKRKTYIVAAGFLTTIVLGLIVTAQVLSHAGSTDGVQSPSVQAIAPVLQHQSVQTPEPKKQEVNVATQSKSTPEPIASASLPVTSAPAEPRQEVMPGVLRLEQPQFSDSLINSARDERVTVRVRVDSTGKALQAVVLMSTNPSFDAPVIAAVLRSEFTPHKPGNNGVDSWVTIPFSFTR